VNKFLIMLTRTHLPPFFMPGKNQTGEEHDFQAMQNFQKPEKSRK